MNYAYLYSRVDFDRVYYKVCILARFLIVYSGENRIGKLTISKNLDYLSSVDSDWEVIKLKVTNNGTLSTEWRNSTAILAKQPVHNTDTSI